MDWNYQTTLRRFSSWIAGKELALAVCVVLAVVAAGIGFGIENNKLVPTNPAVTSHYTLEPHNHLSFMANWDGRNYLDIAVNGYRGAVQTNFFPLYPLLIRAVNYVVGSPLWSALLLAWAAFVGALYVYFKLLKELYPKLHNLERLSGVLLFALFPTGIFLFLAYTESLFAFLALAAIYCALKKRPFMAGLYALLATATHINGLFVVVLVALLLWEKRESLWRIAGGAVMGCLGIAGYAVFLWHRFGNPLEFVASQKGNGWLSYGNQLLAQLPTRKGVFFALVLVSVWYWWHRRRSFAIYSALYACIILLGNLGGYGRYVLVDFPIHLMFYDYFRDRKLGYSLVLAIMATSWMYFLLQFAAGYTGG